MSERFMREYAFIALGIIVTSAHADVGSIRATLPSNPPTGEHFCAIGLAFDGMSLYTSRCFDRNVYRLSPSTGQVLQEFDTGISELPAGLAYDAKRNGLWIGTQGGVGAAPATCGQIGMPIYFWDFDDDSLTWAFTIPLGSLNPATGYPFLNGCFLDGLAYRENSPSSDLDDEIWCKDTTNYNIGVFRVNGSLFGGFDATSIQSNLRGTGLAIGSGLLYLSDDGLGDVVRAEMTTDVLLPVDTLVSSTSRWEADMECDGVTFSPAHVMWVRSSPQCNPRGNPNCNGSTDVITAYEIEPGGCGAGPSLGACCDPNDPPCREVPQAACHGAWHGGVSCADLEPACFPAHRIILLDRTGSMQTVVLPEGDTLCERARRQAKQEVMDFFSREPSGSSVSVWTFHGDGPTPLTSGFVGAAEATAALDALFGVACSNLTPLAESICAAVDSIVGTFPAEPFQTLEISIISDGLENNSGGTCAGPASTAGNSCVLNAPGDQLFDVGSWQRKVCDYMLGHAVANTTLWGDICNGCPLSGSGADVETGLLQGPGVSDVVFFQALAKATGGRFIHADTTPPPFTGTTPLGVTGACCLPSGQCQDNLTEAACSIQFGIHRGQGSTCDNLPTPCPPAIPTISLWGMVVLGLSIVAGGSLVVFQRQRVQNAT
jgi:hypothetical protein